MWLTVHTAGAEDRDIRVTGDRFLIGRDEDCDLVLDDPQVSRQHASLSVMEDGRTELKDLGSSNGVRVNGRIVHGPVVLEGGERIQIGETEVVASPDGPSRGTVVQSGFSGVRVHDPVDDDRDDLRPARGRRGLVAGIAGALAVAAGLVVLGLVLTGALGDDDESLSDVVAEARPSVVVVNASNGTGDGGTGSGWVLDAEQGLIVTNHHVVNSGSLFTVSVRSGAPQEGAEDSPLEERDAELVGTAPCEDLAVLRTAPEGLRTLPLSSQDDLRQGDQVTALGFPGTESDRIDYVQTTGTVSDVRTSFSNDQLRIDVPDLPNLILTDTSFNPGNSGGPLVNGEGELVGIATGNRGSQNYAIGVDRVERIVSQLRRGVSIGWTGLGLDFDPIFQGAIVTNVVAGTPAAAAGITPPQLLTAIERPRRDPDRIRGTLADYCDAVGGLERRQSFVARLRPLRESPDGGYRLTGAPAERVRLSLK